MTLLARRRLVAGGILFTIITTVAVWLATGNASFFYISLITIPSAWFLTAIVNAPLFARDRGRAVTLFAIFSLFSASLAYWGPHPNIYITWLIIGLAAIGGSVLWVMLSILNSRQPSQEGSERLEDHPLALKLLSVCFTLSAWVALGALLFLSIQLITKLIQLQAKELPPVILGVSFLAIITAGMISERIKTMEKPKSWLSAQGLALLSRKLADIVTLYLIFIWLIYWALIRSS
jgi:hypothetical protein